MTRRALLLLAPLCVGCGLTEGELVLYRVSIEPETLSIDCYYPEEVAPPNVVDDDSTFRATNTFGIYRGPDDGVVLDAGPFSLPGTETDEGYEFAGHQIDTTYLGMDNLEAKLSVVTTIRITVLVDGSSIEGDVATVEQERCDFLTATPSPGLCERVPDCVRSARYVGVQLDDAAVANYVDKPNPI
jgi:hypothetical protein